MAELVVLLTWCIFEACFHSNSIKFFITIPWYHCRSVMIKSEGGDELEGLNQPSAKAACQERGARLVEVF